MRFRWLCLTVLLLCSSVALAQQAGIPQPPPAQLPTLNPNDPIDAVMLQWERAMGAVNTLWAGVTRKDVNKVFATTEVLSGYAKYIKPNKASLWLVNKDPKKSQDYERLVCNGQTAYVWEPSKKVIQVFEFPKPQQGQINDDNFVSMLFGMKAAKAKQRYTLSLNPPADKYYIYIQVEPREPQDKAEFTTARLALRLDNFMPVQIYFRQPNGNERFWDFPSMQINQPLDPQEFNQPIPPQGWQLQKATAEGPRAIRAQK